MRKVILVRHGESTGNRDNLWAGITDHELTNHGYTQAERLGQRLAASQTLIVESVFCSDLRRAWRTAAALTNILNGKDNDKLAPVELVRTPLLREQDLGWREGKSLKDRDSRRQLSNTPEGLRPGESKAEMDIRARQFIREHLTSWLTQVEAMASETVPTMIIVSHGLFLLRLYGCLLAELNIVSAPSASWSNTGCTTISIKMPGMAVVTDVNNVDHLKGLKRVRHAGSGAFDERQRTIGDFFTNPKRYRKETDSPSGSAPELPEAPDLHLTSSCQAIEDERPGIRLVDLGSGDPSIHLSRHQGESIDWEIAEAVASIDAACDAQTEKQ
ncbi:hypothetical protein PYCC9005_001937 [Savitreella phatthalungensis]